MIEYKYKKRENKFTENGHTMFETDVLQRLKRLADLEEQVKQKKLLPIQRVSNNEVAVCQHQFDVAVTWEGHIEYYKCSKCGAKQTDC